ncbi:hypothetical protein [Flavivirga rizhaonensis]|uniref:Uncharacterized protein n=1 Tax=Flavivirga rizhaonensis TaxID=2559571 RepID=A0A4S1DZS3_9FLAO|nr:hypothetical protein [Flavivirga rizhaonensis]TGV03757.1 hypothetical protein EM932_04920 [Flavivirga rizhaonensis]
MRLPLLFILFCVVNLSAQEDEKTKSINDFNFESTTNPAFSILEETPTVINTPENLKSLALYVSNGFSDGNIALETNPYWLITNTKDKSYKDYRGIKKNKNSEYIIDPFKSIQTNTSFSLGYISKKFQGFEDDKKTIAIGIRTTLLELYGKKRTKKVLNVINVVDKEYSNEAITKFDKYIRGFSLTTPDRKKSQDYVDNKVIPQAYTDAAVKFLQRFTEYASVYTDGASLVKDYFEETSKKVLDFYFNPKNIKPLIRLDGALAYSLLFKENEINANTASRVGSWLTLDVALKFNDKNYFHVYGITRYIDNGFNIDATQNYFDTSFWDVGGKLELELNKFKLSYEYLNRDGDGDQYRSVGNIVYQINKKISIIGGFGKDFPEDDNLITILGINWGLDLGESPFTK